MSNIMTNYELTKAITSLRRKLCCIAQEGTAGDVNIVNIDDDQPDTSQTDTIQILNTGEVILVDSSGETFSLNLDEIDVFLIAGQSNAKGMSGASGAAASPNPDPGTVYQYWSGSFGEVTDEVGDANTGSAWPSFGITWYNTTGRKICFVQTAVNATAQTAAADTGAGNWSPTGTLFDNSVTRVNDAIAAILTAGMTPIFRGVLWCQGENDANAINAATITENDYRSALATMIADYRTEFGAMMPFYIFRTGTRTDVSDTGYAAVRNAQDVVADADQLLTKVVFRNAFDFVARSLMVDIVHYTQIGYNEMGHLSAENILSGTYDSIQKQGNVALYFPKTETGTGISVSKRVGIGTRNPTTARLVVQDSSSFAGHFMGGATGVSTVRVENPINGTGAGAGVRFYNNAGIVAQIIAYSQLATSFGPASSFLFHVVPGNARIITNSGAIDFATGSTGMANNKASIKNNGQFVVGSGDLAATTNALLDLQSTTMAFCPPRMTTTQRDAITSPSAGMMVYNTSTNKLNVYTTAWEEITSA